MVKSEIDTIQKILGGNDTLYLFKNEDGQSHSDLILWRSLKSGRRDAFNQIFDKYVAALFNYGSRFTKNEEIIEDGIQDVFVEVWSRRESLSDTSSIKFYLFKALRRRLVRTLYESKRHSTACDEFLTHEDDVNFSCEFNLIQVETNKIQTELLKSHVEQLSKRQKEAVYLRYYEQLTYESIASLMNLSVPSTYTLVGKAIASLREALVRKK
jgi:RNA polymerase sigma factor (sigma-70 family)